MITAQAPAKVVLWGEYAVLEGAPAAVLAVDRFARCTIESSEVWRFSAKGFPAPNAELDQLPTAMPTEKVALVPWHVLRDFPNSEPLALTMDTETFYRSGTKLGLGSSAALCVALHAALAARMESPPNFEQALATHRRLQGGRGSGIDVAASFHGGCLRFQNGTAQRFANPLRHYSFVWVGKPARTGPKLDRFAAYLTHGNRNALNALAVCSDRLFDNSTIDELRNYIDALKRLDTAADLGIYSLAHQTVEKLASAHGLVYKPCGAGGGDVGMVVAKSKESLVHFKMESVAQGIAVLPVRPATDGVRVDRG